MTRPKKAEAMRRLQVALEKIPDLKNLESDFPEFRKWRRNTRLAIENVFGVGSDHVKEFTDISDWEFQLDYVSALDRATALLESMSEEIWKYWEDENQELTSLTAQNERRKNTNEIFIIHGRDNEAKETLARFLEHLSLKPIILHEQSNQGRTIIEKFEQYAQVGFAVTLLTPDDVGALQEDRRSLKPRARQNVIFEFGYFIGRLGREHVCALTKGDIEIPSDYEGVIYIPLDDSEGWKMKLVKEFKNAGLDVDANRAF